MVLLLAVSLLLLLTPIWTHIALDLTGGAVAGADRATAHAASDQTVAQLVLNGDFSRVIAPDETPLYTTDEIGHMRDVRFVLFAFLAVALASVAVVAYALRRRGQAVLAWHSIRRGAAWLMIGLVVLGVVGVLAFGVAFEVFHRVFFPGGNWAFPPDSNLIRLYPYGFWQLSAAALGVLALAGAALVWVYANRQLRRQIWT